MFAEEHWQPGVDVLEPGLVERTRGAGGANGGDNEASAGDEHRDGHRQPGVDVRELKALVMETKKRVLDQHTDSLAARRSNFLSPSSERRTPQGVPPQPPLALSPLMSLHMENGGTL